MEDYSQQQPQYPQGSYESIATTGREDMAQWDKLLDHEAILITLEHQLKNEFATTDKDNNVVWEQKGKPLVNDIGINSLLYLLRPYISSIITLSNYKDYEILDRAREMALNLTFLLMEKQEEFGIDEANLSCIKNLCVNCVESSYRKALNGNLAKIFSRTSSTREVISEQSQNKMGKFLGRLG